MSKKLLIILGSVLIVLILGGIFSYFQFFSQKDEKTVQEKQKPKETIEQPGPIFDLKTFIVNLLDDSGRRYLKINIKLELSDEKVQEEINQKMDEIRDNLLVLFSSKSYEAVANVAGKLRLRNEIITRINNILNIGEIRKVYFTDFVIQ